MTQETHETKFDKAFQCLENLRRIEYYRVLTGGFYDYYTFKIDKRNVRNELLNDFDKAKNRREKIKIAERMAYVKIDYALNALEQESDFAYYRRDTGDWDDLETFGMDLAKLSIEVLRTYIKANEDDRKAIAEIVANDPEYWLSPLDAIKAKQKN